MCDRSDYVVNRALILVEAVDSLKVLKYELCPNGTTLELRPGGQWSICYRGQVLGRWGEWEPEPEREPSFRDVAYLYRCQYGSEMEALEVWNTFVGGGG